jgi:hypothetical protein
MSPFVNKIIENVTPYIMSSKKILHTVVHCKGMVATDQVGFVLKVLKLKLDNSKVRDTLHYSVLGIIEKGKI